MRAKAWMKFRVTTQKNSDKTITICALDHPHKIRENADRSIVRKVVVPGAVLPAGERVLWGEGTHRYT